jgi:hypothetical protein
MGGGGGSVTCVALRTNEKYHRRPACVCGMTAGIVGIVRLVRTGFRL